MFTFAYQLLDFGWPQFIARTIFFATVCLLVVAIVCHLKTRRVEQFIDEAFDMITMREHLQRFNFFSRITLPFRRQNHRPTISSPISARQRYPSTPRENAFTEPIPIHELTTLPKSQPECFFFNGRIPPEIRTLIFSYALTQTPSTGPQSTYHASVSRPGDEIPTHIPTSLLQTCRLIYLETYHLPSQNREHVFWHAPERGPGWDRMKTMHNLYHEDYYFSLMSRWQLPFIKEIKLFTQMFWLERSFERWCEVGVREGYLSGVEKLKVGIRRGDWWWNETNEGLFINPRFVIETAEEMLESISYDRNAARDGRKAQAFTEDGWGSYLKLLPSLKELEIEFETSDDKVAELESIIEWAKTWRFPMNEGNVLSAEGGEVEKWNWTGPMEGWSDECPYCGMPNFESCADEPNAMGEECAERRRKMDSGVGPELHVRRLRWKLVRDEEVGK